MKFRTSNDTQIDNHVVGHSLPVLFCFRERGVLVRGSEAGGCDEDGGEDGESKEDSRFTMSLVSCRLLCLVWVRVSFEPFLVVKNALSPRLCVLAQHVPLVVSTFACWSAERHNKRGKSAFHGTRECGFASSNLRVPLSACQLKVLIFDPVNMQRHMSDDEFRSIAAARGSIFAGARQVLGGQPCTVVP